MRRYRDNAEPELNLLPIMNLFVALIPFLLVGTAFYHLSVLNVSVPTNTDGIDVSDPAKKKNVKVTMTLQINKSGFKVFGMCEDLGEKELMALTKSISNKNKKFRFKELNKFLATVKKRYKKSDTIVIVPDKTIPYRTLIEAIDAARKIKIRDKEHFMFTNVVVSSTV